jgi:hypothetical protein
MQYNSVPEYFSKLQNRSLVVLLSSLLLFVMLAYFMLMRNLTPVMLADDGFSFAVMMAVVAMADAGLAFFLARLLLRKSKAVVSLGERMDLYARASFLRFVMLLSSAFILMVAFFLTGLLWLLMLCAINLLNFWIVWPTRSCLCRELKLRANEREVIYGK